MNAVNNYFKVVGTATNEDGEDYREVRILPFNDRERSSTEAAFVEALDNAELLSEAVVSVWLAPPHAGPWDGVELVGHRNLKTMEDELAAACNRLDMCAEQELDYVKGLIVGLKEEIAARVDAAGRRPAAAA